MPISRHRAIDTVAAEWDGLVPRDLPHLRAGFLRAVERGKVVENPAYLLARDAAGPVAAALTYTVWIDSVAHTPPRVRTCITRIRKAAPRFLWRAMRVCGSPVSNGEAGLYFHPRLSEVQRKSLLAEFARELQQSGGLNQTLYFKEFTQSAVAAHAGSLEQLGYFSVASGAGTRLELPWASFGDYLTAMRRHYRQLINRDRKKGEGLSFELRDSFADLADVAARLYDGVYARAEYQVEKVTLAFFAAVSAFDQAKLLVARCRASGEVLGCNLLLFGERTMQNLFIGFDYASNKAHHLYFNLVEQSLMAAIEHGCTICLLGQDSYEFKARLGAKPFPLTAYMRHRLWPVHALLRSNRERFFPREEEVVEHDVFQEK